MNKIFFYKLEKLSDRITVKSDGVVEKIIDETNFTVEDDTNELIECFMYKDYYDAVLKFHGEVLDGN